MSVERPTLRLKPRTTYLNRSGERVNIYGLAKAKDIDGQRIWWSIQGDHYAEDGRRVGLRELTGPSCLNPKYERILYPLHNFRTICEEDATEEAKLWWAGVT